MMSRRLRIQLERLEEREEELQAGIRALGRGGFLFVFLGCRVLGFRVCSCLSSSQGVKE